MALTDDLATIAARAKEAETRAAAVTEKARAELEQDVSSARASAQAYAERLRSAAAATDAKVGIWWTGVHRSWNEHAAEARDGINGKRAEHHVEQAKRRADDAEGFAAFAIEVANWAVAEAEYAVLYAALVRLDAEQVEAEHRPTSASGPVS